MSISSSSTAVVHTPVGGLRGRTTDTGSLFLGVPYAAPPIGAARLAPPRPVVPWDGVRDATAFGPISVQDEDPLPMLLPGTERYYFAHGAVPGEDCLSLNVWTPAADGERRPVLVWIHGGAFLAGSGSGEWEDGAALSVAGDLVVVTVNYRLGVLGGLDLTRFEPDSGNLFLRDQVAALTWVRDTIEHFGGDPDRVTVAGQSAGAMSIAALLTAPAARGLFRRAIVQSGHDALLGTPERAAEHVDRVLHELRIDPRDDVMAALRAASPLRLLAAQRAVGTIPLAVPDGRFAVANGLDELARGAARGIDLLTGTNAQENKLFSLIGWSSDGDGDDRYERGLQGLVPQGGERLDAIRAAYAAVPEADRWDAVATDHDWAQPNRAFALAHADGGGRTYRYRLDWFSSAANGRVGAAHLVDVPFVFANLDQPGTADLLGDAHGAAARALSDAASSAWIAFVRDGDPRAARTPDWTPFTRATPRTMVLAPQPAAEDDLDAHRLDLWAAQAEVVPTAMTTVR